MPISPANMKLYPGGSIRSPEWLAIRERIRARAGNCCEECGIRNLAFGYRRDAIASGEKTFEVRRNDRAFQTGDLLVLEKYDPEHHCYELDGHDFNAKTKAIRKRISFLLQGGQFGIEAGFCVLGLQDPTP